MVAHRRCSPSRRFSRDKLLYIKNQGCVGIDRRLRRFLFLLRLLRVCSRPHHTQPSVQRQIPVRITKRTSVASVSHSPNRPPHSFLQNIPRIERHHPSARENKFITYGLLNVRSLKEKVDAVSDLTRDRSVDVMLLTESWHDSDSNCIGRLRLLGYGVLDCPRPRPPNQLPSLATNHGGVVALASPGIRLSTVHVDVTPSTFEHLLFRVKCGASSNVILLVYRTGNISSAFFDELSAILDCAATFSDPFVVAGDLNFHMERITDPNTEKLLTIMSSYGLSCQVTKPTHSLGGILDVVFTSLTVPLEVSVHDPGLSDHFLISWRS